MNQAFHIENLHTEDREVIETIASWYNAAWGTPMEKTIRRLSTYPSSDTLLQAVAYKNGAVIGSGGLCNTVNIYQVYPDLDKFGPWIALLYIQEDYRNQGAGQQILNFLEEAVLRSGYPALYLYTFTAERFYQRNGWKVIREVRYKQEQTVIMKKTLL